MNERIKNHVEELFAGAPRSRRAIELKDELIANLNDRYNDLIAKGQDEGTAYNVVIAGIGDIDELIRGLREQEVFDPVQIQMQRQKSALLVSVSVAIFIMSLIVPITFNYLENVQYNPIYQPVAVILMLICWAVATMLLVYNAMSKPKYVKLEDTMVEDFKEWKVNTEKQKTMRKSVNSLVWMLTVVVYLMLGLFFNAWHPGWLVFPLAAVVTHIIRMVYALKEDK